MSTEGVKNLFIRESAVLVDETEMISKWKTELLSILAQVKETVGVHPEVYALAVQAIDTWSTHPDHGAKHSYHVFKGMEWLAKEEGIEHAQGDSRYQALAVLHDLAQLLPFKDISTGVNLAGDQRKAHADTMARIIYMLADKLCIPKSERDDLIVSIRHHDDEYLGVHFAHFSDSGKLLADADKLFGASLSRNPNEMAIDAIERNQKGANAPDGWYLLRDLSVEERNAWQYGDRWWKDRVCAVRTDIFGIQFYTPTARKLAMDRAASFLEQAVYSYGQEYDQTADVLSALQTALAEGQGGEIFFSGKNKAGKQPLLETVSDISNIQNIIRDAYIRPLDLGTQRENQEARGWKVTIKIYGKEYVIDPSIARFIFSSEDPIIARQNFLQAIVNAFIGKE